MEGIPRNESRYPSQFFPPAVKKPDIRNPPDIVLPDDLLFPIIINLNRNKVFIDIGENVRLGQDLVQFPTVRSPIGPEIEKNLFLRIAGYFDALIQRIPAGALGSIL